MGVNLDPGRPATFLIAGVQKGGTTALFEYLKDHPDLAMASEKELHFFDDETSVNWSRPDYGGYHDRFDPSRPGLRGEATPIYIYWPNAIERIARYNPAIRLILLFRDPVERAWSHWRMERSRGAEALPFQVCIREGRARVDDPSAPGHHRVHSYVERGFYGEQLSRIYKVFPREQVFTASADDLRRAPALLLRNVCDFLGVGSFNQVSPLESHVGSTGGVLGDLQNSDRSYLSKIYADDQRLFKKLGGPAL